MNGNPFGPSIDKFLLGERQNLINISRFVSGLPNYVQHQAGALQNLFNRHPTPIGRPEQPATKARAKVNRNASRRRA